jgi:hypothetical protein
MFAVSTEVIPDNKIAEFTVIIEARGLRLEGEAMNILQSQQQLRK